MMRVLGLRILGSRLYERIFGVSADNGDLPLLFQLPHELHDTQLNFLDFSQPHRAKEVPVTDCSA